MVLRSIMEWVPRLRILPLASSIGDATVAQPRLRAQPEHSAFAHGTPRMLYWQNRRTTQREGVMPSKDHGLGEKISRRMLVAGAAAGALSLAADPASAQRCAGPPPPHTKGPLVWLDLDQNELND